MKADKKILGYGKIKYLFAKELKVASGRISLEDSIYIVEQLDETSSKIVLETRIPRHLAVVYISQQVEA